MSSAPQAGAGNPAMAALEQKLQDFEQAVSSVDTAAQHVQDLEVQHATFEASAKAAGDALVTAKQDRDAKWAELRDAILSLDPNAIASSGGQTSGSTTPTNSTSSGAPSSGSGPASGTGASSSAANSMFGVVDGGATLGFVLATPDKRALYTHGPQAIEDPNVLAVWQPYVVPSTPQGVENVSVTVLSDGRLQAAYNHEPLYTYAQEQPGQTTGDGQDGGQWQAVPAPAGLVPAQAGTSGASAAIDPARNVIRPLA